MHPRSESAVHVASKGAGVNSIKGCYAEKQCPSCGVHMWGLGALTRKAKLRVVEKSTKGSSYSCPG